MTERGSGGVQSLHRAVAVLEALADAAGPMAFRDIADAVGLPQPTTHRLLQTLVDCGYARQLSDRRYALGFRLVRLGAVANRLVGADTEAVLAELVRELGETANLAILAGDRAEYVAQAPSAHSMRMFTEVGRQVDLHATGVGKALMAQMPDSEVAAIVDRTGLVAHTPRTVTTRLGLQAALAEVRAQGFAIDDEEQELGVRCVAMAIPAAAGFQAAVSVSGPVTRVDDALVTRAVPLLRAAGRRLIGD